jgi:hypothetical protein
MELKCLDKALPARVNLQGDNQIMGETKNYSSLGKTIKYSIAINLLLFSAFFIFLISNIFISVMISENIKNSRIYFDDQALAAYESTLKSYRISSIFSVVVLFSAGHNIKNLLKIKKGMRQ